MHAPEWSTRDAADSIARPSASDDKYSRGVLGVATGSEEFPGAAVLGVAAALATGVGMVRYLGPPRPSQLVLAACPEAVTAPGRVQAWLAGSGMSESLSSTDVQRVVDDALPTVLDAGALDRVRTMTSPTVITPHYRELGRLLDRDQEEVAADPAGSALAAAESLHTVVLLKGSRTVVASPDGSLIICPTASPWLATAGTGDVLAGILGALVATHSADLKGDGAQRSLARLAASASVVHGLAASRASGGGPFTVRDLIRAIAPTIAGLIA